MSRNPCLWAPTLVVYFLGLSSQTLAQPSNLENSGRPSTPQVFDSISPLEGETPAWLTERRVIGENNLETIIASPDTESARPSRSVARVETHDGKGFCTAARVGRDLFLTNFHCYEFVDCDDVQFHLGYEKNFPANDQKIFRCAEVLAFNEHYDYALYRVEKSPYSKTTDSQNSDGQELESRKDFADLIEFPIASLWVGRLAVNQPLMVASHPGARLKEIDQSAECKLLSTKTEIFLGRETITHACDTEGGSSGSPVFDRKTGHIVALHWGGTDEYNMAVPISLIVQDWKSTLSEDVLSELKLEK